MDAVLQSFLQGSPVLLLHVAVTLAMLIAGVAVYVWITPHKEFALVRQGNVAAAVSLSAAILGIGVPLAFSMAASVSILDIVVWGTLIVVLQLAAYLATELLFKGLSARIDAGEMGPAIVLAAIKLAVAAVNAAAVGG